MSGFARHRGYGGAGSGRALLGLGLGLALSAALANPEGPQVVSGSASFTRPNANVLDVHNSHNAIINWQSFNIGAGQTTNFHQPSRASAVLNRVMSNSPSQIYGNLNSNGRVFLINQHGLMIGAGAQINTAGFFGSTLNITNEDFLSGNLKFEGGGFGGISNQGYIHAGPGGNVVLIAPDIENGGVIEVDDGNVILAAGESIRITSLNDAAIEFDVQAPENTIVNLGSIIANQGAARLFAGNLKHSGDINATGIVRNADGSISLVAQKDIVVDAGAMLTADGDSGGDITVRSLDGDVYFSGGASARGLGQVGGRIQILGERVGLFGDAVVDASGAAGGGEVLVGGDFQGQGEVQTARQTQVGPHARIHADALDAGDGGKVIVWANEFTLFEGTATAKGGADSGDGGFIEISGSEALSYTGRVDTTAANGSTGTVLFDPRNINVFAGSLNTYAPGSDDTFADNTPLDVDFSNASIEAALNLANVVLQANNNILWSGPLAPTGTNGLTLQAGQSVTIQDTQGTFSTNGGNLTLIANSTAADGVVDANRLTGAGGVSIGDGVQTATVDTGGGNLTIDVRDGFGISNAQQGSVLFDALSTVLTGGGTLSITGALDATFNGSVNPGVGVFDVIVDRDVTINNALTTSAAGLGGPMTFIAGQSILVNAGITTDNGLLKLYANDPNADPVNRGIGNAVITMPDDPTTIDTGTGNAEFWMNFGAAGTAGNITVGNIDSAHVLIKHNGSNPGGSILGTNSGVITASSVFIDHDGPTDGTIGLADPPLNMIVDNVGAHIHAPTSTGGIFITANPNSGTDVTVGNTCYGTGAPPCNTFPPHVVLGVETIDGGGAIELNIGGNLIVDEPIAARDAIGTTNPGHILINATGSITTNTPITNSTVNSFTALNANDHLFINADITGNGVVTLDGDADINPGVSDGADFIAGVTITSVNDNINLRTANGLAQSAGDINFTAGLDINISDGTNFNGIATLNAGNDVNIKGDDFTANETADIFAQVINITAVNSVNLIAGAAANSHAILESFAGDITITAATLNLDISGAGIDSDALVIANGGAGALNLGSTTCPNCNPLAALPAPGTNVAGVLASNFSPFISWDGDTDGDGDNLNWTDPLNWSIDAVPLRTDDVVIGAFAVTIAAAADANTLALGTGGSLNITGGTLTVANGLTLDGSLSVQAGANLVVQAGGAINDVLVNPGGVLNVIGGNFASQGDSLFNGTFGQSGAGATSTFTGTARFNGPFNMVNGLLQLASGATLTGSNNNWTGGTITGGASLVLGALSGDGTTLGISGPNDKTLSTIQLDMNRNDVNMAGTGNLILAGATINNTGGTSFNKAGDGDLLGTGVFVNNGGRFNHFSGNTTIGPNFDFQNDSTSTVAILGGTLVFQDPDGGDQGFYNLSPGATLRLEADRNFVGAFTSLGTVHVAGTLTNFSLPAGLNTAGLILSGAATLNGNPVTVGSSFLWAGGALGVSALTMSPGSLLTISSPTPATLPTVSNLNGSIILANNATLDLSGTPLQLGFGRFLTGAGTIQGNVVNNAGAVIVGTTGTISNLTITGGYTHNASAALVVEAFNNGLTTISDRLIVGGPVAINGGTLVIGFVTSSLGLVTASFNPFQFAGPVSGGFDRVIDAGGNLLFVNFSGGTFTVLGAPPKIPDKIVDDLIKFAEDKNRLRELIASNQAEAEAIMQALRARLEDDDGALLVCR